LNQIHDLNITKWTKKAIVSAVSELVQKGNNTPEQLSQLDAESAHYKLVKHFQSLFEVKGFEGYSQIWSSLSECLQQLLGLFQR
jgi:hypothetical protein